MPCSACGLSKRHLFDQAALEGGYDVVATGHNLDDEAAVLFGNVLRWHTEYLGRQLPVLPAANGFPRKVKPLVRLGEREMAAYCVVRGIDYIVEECPMAVGNKHLGYKDALNAIEVTSPGSKHDFYFGFLSRASERFRAEAEAEQAGPAPVPVLRRAHDRRARAPSAGWSSGPAATARSQVRCRSPTRPAPSLGPPVSAPLRRGRPGAAHRQQEPPLPGGAEPRAASSTPTPASWPTTTSSARPKGITVRSTRGQGYRVLRPTLADFILKMPRGAQVIYPKDLGPDPDAGRHHPRGAGARVGRRIGRPVDDHAAGRRHHHRLRAARGLRQPGPGQRGVLPGRGRARRATTSRSATATTASTGPEPFDRIVLDLPEPWRVVPHALDALAPGGMLVAYTPEHHPGHPAARGARRGAFAMAETLEVLQRSWHIEGQAVRPDHRMVAHTGFLTHARLVGR